MDWKTKKKLSLVIMFNYNCCWIISCCYPELVLYKSCYSLLIPEERDFLQCLSYIRKGCLQKENEDYY